MPGCLKGLMFLGVALLAPLLPGDVAAGEVTVVDAKAQQSADGTWRFDVTLKHADSGWDHYADRWDVLLPDGTVAGSRTLHHPHVEEQPFTRSLGGVAIDPFVTEVLIRGHDSQHGDGPELLRLRLK